MDRRKFLRDTSLAGVLGLSGCSTPFDGVSAPTPANGTGSSETPTSTPTPESPETRSGTALTGVYSGGPGSDLISNLDRFSTWLSQKPAVAMVYINAFIPRKNKKGFVKGALTDIWERNHVPLISWKPYSERKQQTPEDVEARIANGNYDDHLEAWATLLNDWARPRGEKTRGRRFYFRPAYEMNGDWFPWSALDSKEIAADAPSTPNSTTGQNPATGTPDDYIMMWRHIYDVFSETGLDETNVQWIWSPNAEDIGNIRAERYYPGDEYVDWVGLDGFNFGGSQRYENDSTSNWRSPNRVFGSMVKRIRDLNDKPLALIEMASSSVPDSGDGYRPEKKAQWIQDAFEYVDENDIKMVCWFNVRKTGADESDWMVFGGKRGTSRTTIEGERYRVYGEYKRSVSASKHLAARTDYPPLLTDAEFAGEF
ncbi:glycoside hydrolase family 26 protein [Halococcus sp. IIIV-5B]|uniref:glycoside hydrolase family 26 protein n=1 Tax=Halococcus sp. IIIV-5B TaxID=2321230 RepID=UPI000E73C1FE|nr:glycosyl hydrolase [Halococcus sp. IIIV-5B]RJT00357.1 endoglucanase [Halococcus sp. IIIV-5B]